MPNYENNNFHGSLIITIDVEFPKNTFSEQDKKGSYNLFISIQFQSLCKHFMSTIYS